MVKKWKVYLIALITLVMFITTFFGLSTMNAYAFGGTNSSLTEQELYNATNTYNVETDCFKDNGNFDTITDSSRVYSTQYEISYNLTQKNNNQVMGSAQITVLTHGLGSNAGTWSNDFSANTTTDNFAYDTDSLISKIVEKVGSANVYWADMKNYKDFKLYDITTLEGTYSSSAASEVDNLTDISRHIIVVFEAYRPLESNANIYYQFNYMLSRIIYDVKIANGGILPKINLVGHSRGGLTNLQYALDHPDLVSTLVSLGTPYFSSTTANLFGEMFMGAGDGLDDILNPDIYYEYNTRWNQNYNTLYSDIDVYAMGSYHTLAALVDVLDRDYGNDIPDWAEPLATVILEELNRWKLSTFSSYITDRIALAGLTELLDMLYTDSQVVDVAEIIFQEINYDVYPMFVSWYNDILVNLESQLGTDTGAVGYEYSGSYLGFNRVVRPFLMFDDYVDYEKVSQASAPVGHNLIARDQLVIAEIVSVLDLGVNNDSAYVTIENEDGTVTFVRYRGEYGSSVFYVPEAIDGKTVTEISAFAFNGETNITEIVLPNTIKRISAYAFAGLENLTTISFTGNGTPQLEKIGYGAFAGCTSLNRFNSLTIGMLRIPDNVEQIDCYAFYGTAFESIMFGSNVNYIGDVAFANMPNLKYITISSNTKYFSQDNVLYNSDGWLMQYPVGWSNSSFSVPITVANVPIRHISQFAFMGESDLTTINLHNVISIDSYAFMGCTCLATFNNAANVEYVGSVALDDTQIMSQTQDFVTLGKVLYRYNGTDSVLQSSDFPEGITRIASNAFCCNDGITTINLPLNITDIDNFAFVDCANLESIQYLNATLPDIGEYSFVSLNSGFKFYCRKSLIDGLDSTSNWYNEGDILEPISTEVYFEDIDVYRTFYYGETVTLPTEEISGKYIKGWLRVDETSNNTYGNYLTPSAWNETSSTAVFRADTIIIVTYTLYFYNGEKQVGFAKINIGDDYEITPTGYVINGEPYSFTNSAEMSNCVYDGYYGPAVVDGNTIATFTGWVMNGNFLTSGQWLESYSDNVLYVYASWEASDYTVTLDKNGGNGGDSSITVQYGVVMPSATAPTKTGYTFRGYYTGTNGSGTKYYNADMTSARVWDIAQDTTLYAYWQGNSYTVTLNKDGGNDGDSSITVQYGKAMPSAKAPKKTGHVFKGYYTGTNGSGTKYYDANMTSVNAWDKTSGGTLYAYWEKAQYTISLINSAGTTRTTTVTYGESIEVDSIPARTDYRFVGYFSQEGGQGTCYVRGVLKQKDGYYQIVGEETDAVWLQEEGGVLYAHWEKLQANITYNLSCAEDSATSSSTVTLTSGQSVTIQPPSWDGYTFDHWEVNGTTYSGQALTYTFTLHISYTTGNVTIYNPHHTGSVTYSDGYIVAYYTKNNCIAEGTLITLADGRQVPVETLTGNEMLLVWNLHTGRFDTAPILFIDHDTIARYKIINLYFSDGTHVKVIDEHAFWDFNLNKYVFLREDAGQYIGHWFNKQITDDNGNMIWTRVQLTNVTITEEYTTAWSPVTYGHLCIYVNGMLSMPGATTGLINIFEVDGETMQIDQAKYLEDIEAYGLFTYEEFAEIYPIPEEMFNAVEGQYLKVSIGKGLIDYETLGKLISSYSQFFE